MAATMGRKKKHAKGRHNDPREAFHLPVQLQLAIECAAALADVPVSKSAVIRDRLEKALRAEGWLPADEDKLRQLVETVGLANLSPHAQAFLQQMGIEEE